MKTILITGCSSGIGYHAAKVLKERGYRVFATARKTEDVEKLKSEGFESFQLDLTDSASMKQALNDILQLTGGTLDAVFNNAGYMQTGAVEDLNRDLDRAQFETNVFGTMELTRLVIPVMRNQGHGRIIQNSSVSGLISVPLHGAYNASKFALEGYTNALRIELRQSPIFVSIINPGPVKSKIRRNAYKIFEKNVEPHQSGNFQDQYKKMEKTYFVDKENQSITEEPQAVVDKLIHALESSRPKSHYFIGLSAKLAAFSRRILPESTLDWVLKNAR